MNITEPKPLTRSDIIAVAAKQLLDILEPNLGDNADWPIHITVSDPAMAAALGDKLNNLNLLLNPNRTREFCLTPKPPRK